MTPTSEERREVAARLSMSDDEEPRGRSCGDCDNLRMYGGVPACIYTEREMSFFHDATDCAEFKNEWSDDD